MGELHDAPAYRLLQALIGAAGDVLMVDLELDERESSAVRSRDGQLAPTLSIEMPMLCSATRPATSTARLQIVDSPRCRRPRSAGRRKPAWSGIRRQSPRTSRSSARNEIGRLIDRLIGPICFSEIAPVLDRAHRSRTRTAHENAGRHHRDEVGRRHHAPRRDGASGSGASAPLGNQRPEVNLLLIPQLEPAGLQRFGHVHRGARRRFEREAMTRDSSRRVPALNGVDSAGSMAMLYSSPIWRTALTMMESGCPMTRTSPRIVLLLTKVSRILLTSMPSTETPSTRRSGRSASSTVSSSSGLAAFAGDEAGGLPAPLQGRFEGVFCCPQCMRAGSACDVRTSRLVVCDVADADSCPALSVVTPARPVHPGSGGNHGNFWFIH